MLSLGRGPSERGTDTIDARSPNRKGGRHFGMFCKLRGSQAIDACSIQIDNQCNQPSLDVPAPKQPFRSPPIFRGDQSCAHGGSRLAQHC